jgi:signal peptidase II
MCIGCDQSSKFLAVKYLQPEGRISYVYDTVRLQYIENTGAFLSLGDTLSKSSRFWLFTVVVFLLLVALIAYAYTISFRYRVKIGALALIAGGGISNLIDRLINNGAVVDFLNIGIGTLRTGIFNIADFLILVGIALILIFHSHGRQENG